MKVENKTIVVTGAGGGIGSELAYALLQKGARVIATDINEENLKLFQQQVNNKNLKIYQLDISK